MAPLSRRLLETASLPLDRQLIQRRVLQIVRKELDSDSKPAVGETKIGARLKTERHAVPGPRRRRRRAER